MNKPYIICHMMTSIDGKIVGNSFVDERSWNIYGYYDVLKFELSPKAWMGGRTSFEQNFTAGKTVNLNKYEGVTIGYEDNVITEEKLPYAIVIDRAGKLGWTSNVFEHPYGINNRVLSVLTKRAPHAYLAYLKALDIPYIIAGDDDVDLPLALHKLNTLFNLDKIALCGGSMINASFFAEDLVDEISVLVTPAVDGASNSLTLAEASGDQMNGFPRFYKLKSAEKTLNDSLHIRYIK